MRKADTKPEIEDLYLQMVRMRLFEETIAVLWDQGLISGELHSGVGEEAIVAGVAGHLKKDDAVALDHRSTPPMVARGVDMTAMILELLGSGKGLCRGMGGHMHLFSREHLAASSGIVGSSAPLGAGFALAAQQLRPGAVSVAFFGEGAVNQGMLLESLNLAVAWKLPVIFVCKDNRWAITTRSSAVTGGNPAARARSFGMPSHRVKGWRVEKVWSAAERAVGRAREGKGPSYIHACCRHPEGHFLGDPLLRVFKEPLRQAKEISGPLLASAVSSPGAGWRERAAGLGRIGAAISSMGIDSYVLKRDPIKSCERLLPETSRRRLQDLAVREVEEALALSLDELEGGRIG